MGSFSFTLNFWGWMVILSIIAAITICGVALMFTYKYVFGESERNCLDYRSSEMVKMSAGRYGDCDWIIDKFMYNGSGFHVASHSVDSEAHGSVSSGSGYVSSYEHEYWVLTKK